MDTKQVGEKLVELCRQGKNLEAIDSLYSPDIVSVEAMGNEQMPAEMRGIEAIRGKNQWWLENHDVHSAAAEGPYPNNDRFAVRYNYDVTAKAGPMAGQRMKMDEIALYTVKDGKIVREEFYYSM
jgi:ketosteroid isomerase-like protein